MKKNFYCFIVLFFLISCDFPSIRREESYFVTNLTGKKLIHQIRYDKEVKGLDTLSFFSEGNSDKAELDGPARFRHRAARADERTGGRPARLPVRGPTTGHLRARRAQPVDRRAPAGAGRRAGLVAAGRHGRARRLSIDQRRVWPAPRTTYL